MDKDNKMMFLATLGAIVMLSLLAIGGAWLTRETGAAGDTVLEKLVSFIEASVIGLIGLIGSFRNRN